MRKGISRDAEAWLDTKKPILVDRRVPLSYIKKVWQKNYRPPITSELVLELVMKVKAELEEKRKNENRRPNVQV